MKKNVIVVHKSSKEDVGYFLIKVKKMSKKLVISNINIINSKKISQNFILEN